MKLGILVYLLDCKHVNWTTELNLNMSFYYEVTISESFFFFVSGFPTAKVLNSSSLRSPLNGASKKDPRDETKLTTVNLFQHHFEPVEVEYSI